MRIQIIGLASLIFTFLLPPLTSLSAEVKMNPDIFIRDSSTLMSRDALIDQLIVRNAQYRGAKVEAEQNILTIKLLQQKVEKQQELIESLNKTITLLREKLGDS